MCEHCTRREFLGTSVLSGLAVAGTTWVHAQASQATPSAPPRKARICVLFTGAPGPADRGWNTDAAHFDKAKEVLAEVEKKLGNVELVIGQVAQRRADRGAVEGGRAGVPVLAINLSCFALRGLVQPILDGNHPLAVFSLPASGHDWMYPHRWQRRAIRSRSSPAATTTNWRRRPAAARDSHDAADPDPALPARSRHGARLRSRRRSRRSWAPRCVAVAQNRFDDLMRSAGRCRSKAKQDAAMDQGPRRSSNPRRRTSHKAARVSVALQNLMKQEQAQGLAIGTCMGWLPRVPLPGVHAAARPRRPRGLRRRHGLVADHAPVPVRHRPSRLPGQRHLRHVAQRPVDRPLHGAAEDGRPGRQAGALPAARAFRGRRQRLRARGAVPRRRDDHPHQAGQPGYDPASRRARSSRCPEKSVHGCRTQIVTEVRDAAKMAANWSSVLETEDAMTLLHRVVFYGDHMESVRHLAELLNMNVVEEV